MAATVFAFPMSFAQQRLWFLEQMQTSSPSYHISGAVRLVGPLDRAALQRALDLLVERHESLRTTFAFIQNRPAQIVVERLPVTLSVIPLDETEDWRAALFQRAAVEARQPFDLTKGPLLRATLIRRSSTEHVLLTTMHHIIADGWSIGVLLRELSIFYSAAVSGSAANLPDLPIQYVDFAHWQREWLDPDAPDGVLDRQLAYWRTRLAGAPILQLPTSYPRPPVQSSNGAIVSFTLPAALCNQLRTLSRQAGTTLSTVLLATFQVLLHRYSGQDDILVGVPVANRNRTEIEGIIGLFVNTLVLRADLSGNPTFRDLLQQLHRTALDAYTHQDLPFEKLVDELQPARHLNYTPLFQVAFTFQDAPLQTLTMPGVLVESLEIHTGTAKCDLTLDIAATEAELDCVLEYNTDLFAPAAAARIAAHFQLLLAGTVADPGRRIGRLPLLTGAEEQQLIAERRSRPGLSDPQTCLHTLFERQAQQRPEAVAVVCDDQQLTYGELDRRANQLAQHLRRLGVGPDTLVGLYLERSLEMIVGLLGILKAGGAYVPLDPAYPQERIAFMLADCRAPVVVTTAASVAQLAALDHRLVCLDRDWPEIAQCSPEPLQLDRSAALLAYVIYTSGSTGRPKGVGVTHANVVRLFESTRHWMHFDHTDVWTLFHSYAFDFSVWELWGALLHGGRLVVVPYYVTRAPDAFYTLLAEQQVTVLSQTPSAFRQLIQVEEQALAELRALSLRYIIFGGEALDPASLRPWFERHGDQQPQLINMYGITETTVHVTYRPLSRADAASAHASPIGCPIPDLSIYLLDRYLNPVPAGVDGEIYVGGAGLARGYLNRPDLTAQRFIADPFGTTPGARLYKTGDTARALPDGGLEYIGRIDAQVKIRGFRIELEEIDSVLRQHPRVSASLTLVREDAPNDKQLVAYVVAHGEQPHQSMLRHFLKTRLPEYMIPVAFVFLEAFPLTNNGKLNRAALPAPDATDRAAEAVYVAPRTALEELLAAIWASALKLSQVGIHDNFFVLGGDSILSLQVLALAQKRGLNFSLQHLFQHPTVAALAQAITDTTTATNDVHTRPFSLVSPDDRRRLPADVEDAYPLTMLQSGMLYHMALAPDSNIYHNTDSYHLRTAVSFDLALFEQAVAAVVARHPILRTGFDLTSYSEPLQLVHTRATLPTVLYDIRHLSAEEQARAIDDLIVQEKRQPFDLTAPTLLRFFIHLRTDDSFQFTLTECHAIIDGWSLNSTLVEIFQYFFALLQHRPLPDLAPLSVSFRDYVALEQEALASPEQQAFWAHRLAGATPLALPRWHSTPPADQLEIRSLTLTVPPAVYVGLQQIVRTTALPLKSVLLAAHLKVMQVVGGNTDVLSGVGMNGRPETLDGAQLRGLFINTVPFRLQLTPGSWLDLIQATFAADQAMLPFRRYPVAAIQQQWGRRQLYEVMFNYLHFHVLNGLAEAVPDLEELGAIRSEGTNATLLVHFQIQTMIEQLTLDLDYNAVQLCREQIEQLGGYYMSVLAAMVAGLHQPHHTFSPLSAAEQRRLTLEWNATQAPYPHDSCLHQLFEAQAARTPASTAVECQGQEWSYAELDRRANRLAAHLQALGVGPDVLVGLYLERSPELMVGLLGVLKAGGAYVPLDPALPAERIKYMLNDARAAVVVTQRRISHQLHGHALPVVELDDDDWRRDVGPAVVALERRVQPDNQMYVIYTSGSTGQPKGTLITHRGAVNYLTWCAQNFVQPAGEGMPIYGSIGFDATLMSLFAPLLSGQRVVVLPEAGGITGLGALLQQERRDFSLIATTPAHLEWLRHMFPDQPIAGGARTIISGGEVLTDQHIAYWREHAPQTRMINVYGPTETVVASTAYEIPAGTTLSQAAPIGRPIANTQLYLLDSYGQPVPAGTAGELFIGGAGVARGYLNRPGLTAEKFVPDPFSSAPGARLYRTGDRAVYLPDGLLVYQGRLDQQLKIRGFRVEPGEIEQALLALEGVADAVVVVHDDTQGLQQLVAYVVPGQEPPPTQLELRSRLLQTLPEYMIPHLFVFLSALPMTVNGKVDRQALPAPSYERPALAATYVTPQNDLEQMIAGIWKHLLKIEQVGIHDNFFELGGHSLLIIRMHRSLQEQLGRELTIAAVLQYPTIHALADYLSQGSGQAVERSHRRIDARREARQDMAQRSQIRDKRRASRHPQGEGNE